MARPDESSSVQEVEVLFLHSLLFVYFTFVVSGFWELLGVLLGFLCFKGLQVYSSARRGAAIGQRFSVWRHSRVFVARANEVTSARWHDCGFSSRSLFFQPQLSLMQWVSHSEVLLRKEMF